MAPSAAALSAAVAAVVSVGLAACQPRPPEGPAVAPGPAALVAAPDALAPPPATAGRAEAALDCRGRLAALLADGAELATDEGVVVVDLDRGDPSGAVVLEGGLPLTVRRDLDPAAPCLLLVDRGGARVALERRVLAQESVESFHVLRSSREPNPAHEAAKLRAREAERATRRSELPGVGRTGDVAADLLGTLFDFVVKEWAGYERQRDLDAAVAELGSTPATLERHELEPYRFSRTKVALRRQAEVSAALVDRRRGRVLRARLPVTERRELAVLDGLHARDHEHEARRRDGITWEELEALERQPLPLPLPALIEGLLAGAGAEEAITEAEIGLAAIAPAAAPRAEQPPRDPRLASVVEVVAGGRRGRGFYVAPEKVVTSLSLVGRAQVVDVVSADGMRSAALVERRDPARELALLHMPRRGPPLLLWDGADPALGTPLELLDPAEPAGAAGGTLRRLELEAAPPSGAARRLIATDAVRHPGQNGSPLLLGDRVLGLGLWRLDAGGTALHHQDIRAFLDGDAG